MTRKVEEIKRVVNAFSQLAPDIVYRFRLASIRYILPIPLYKGVSNEPGGPYANRSLR